jgi:hypothetical protein
LLLQGIDLSQYQSRTPDLTGLSFLIARASIGTKKDSMYDTHIAKAKAAGLVTGAYHFNWDADYDSATATPEEQARFFVKQAGDVDLLFLDVEGAMAFEDAESTAFIAEVHRLGKRCGLYMSASTFRNDGQDYDWIAYWYDNEPHVTWRFWQYGSTTISGSRVDGNLFNGDAAALAAFTQGDSMGLQVTLPAVPVAGSLLIRKGTDSIRVSDGTHYIVPTQATRPAYAAALTGGASESGYLVDLETDEVHFIRGTSAGIVFTPTAGFTQADIDAAVKAAVTPLNDKLAAMIAAAATTATVKAQVAGELRNQAAVLES